MTRRAAPRGATSRRADADEVVAVLLPATLKRPMDDEDCVNNFVTHEAEALRVVDLPAVMNHVDELDPPHLYQVRDTRQYRVGTVRGAAMRDNIDYHVLLDVEPRRSPQAVYTSNCLMNGTYGGVSLGNTYRVVRSADAVKSVTKQPLEVSLCRAGMRDGSVVRHFFPCRQTLERVSDDDLRAFARRHNYLSSALRADDTMTREQYIEYLDDAVQQRRDHVLNVEERALFDSPQSLPYSTMSSSAATKQNVSEGQVRASDAVAVTPAATLAATGLAAMTDAVGAFVSSDAAPAAPPPTNTEAAAPVAAAPPATNTTANAAPVATPAEPQVPPPQAAAKPQATPSVVLPSSEELRDARAMQDQVLALRRENAEAAEREAATAQELAALRAEKEARRVKEEAERERERTEAEQKARRAFEAFKQHAELPPAQMQGFERQFEAQLRTDPVSAAQNIEGVMEVTVRASKQAAELARLKARLAIDALDREDAKVCDERAMQIASYAQRAEAARAATRNALAVGAAVGAGAPTTPTPSPENPINKRFISDDAAAAATDATKRAKTMPPPAPQYGVVRASADSARSAESKEDLQAVARGLRDVLGREPTYDEVGRGLEYVETAEVRASADGSGRMEPVVQARFVREEPAEFDMRDWDPSMFEQAVKQVQAGNGDERRVILPA